jgi:hypothetical protein
MISETIERDSRCEIILRMRGAPPSRIILYTATRIARTFHGRLSGQFFNDDELLALAKLPFAKEISDTGREVRQLDPDRLRNQMQAASARVRREFERIAEGGDFEARFEVFSSRAQYRALTGIVAFGEALGRGGTQLASAISEEFTGNPEVAGVLTAGSQAHRTAGLVMALLETGCEVTSIVDTAERIARSDREPVMLVIVGETDEEIAELREAAEKALDPETAQRVVVARVLDPRYLARMANAQQAGLVVAWSKGLLGGPQMARFVCQVDCPLLLMR